MEVTFITGSGYAVASSKGSKISALIDECEVFEALDEEKTRAAALVVCANAQGTTKAEKIAWATDMLGMLGLLPGQAEELSYITGPQPRFNPSTER